MLIIGQENQQGLIVTKPIKELFENYTILGTIIQDESGYNILDPTTKEKMLDKSISSLKTMLEKLADNM